MPHPETGRDPLESWFSSPLTHFPAPEFSGKSKNNNKVMVEQHCVGLGPKTKAEMQEELPR